MYEGGGQKVLVTNNAIHFWSPFSLFMALNTQNFPWSFLYQSKSTWIQGRSWGNWLEKYIVVEVHWRSKKYIFFTKKSITRPLLPEFMMFINPWGHAKIWKLRNGWAKALSSNLMHYIIQTLDLWVGALRKTSGIYSSNVLIFFSSEKKPAPNI